MIDEWLERRCHHSFPLGYPPLSVALPEYDEYYDTLNELLRGFDGRTAVDRLEKLPEACFIYGLLPSAFRYYLPSLLIAILNDKPIGGPLGFSGSFALLLERPKYFDCVANLNFRQKECVLASLRAMRFGVLSYCSVYDDLQRLELRIKGTDHRL
jgi:hypothetical protein